MIIKANNEIVGRGGSPTADSEYQKVPMRDIRLTDNERSAFADLGGVEKNMNLYSSIRSQLDEIGGYDVYSVMKEQADSLKGKPINMKKWWT